MLIKILIGLGVLVGGVLIFASTKESKFRYERNGLIKATPEQIFPYISQLKRGGEWSPYEKKDPNLKKTFTGTDGEVGAVLEFEGNNESGSGKLEILKIVPHELVQMKLTMTKPVHAENLIEYRLIPENDGTRFSWSMSGDGGFMGKLIQVFIDCEKMVAGDFTQGIQNLKTLIESKEAK